MTTNIDIYKIFNMIKMSELMGNREMIIQDDIFESLVDYRHYMPPMINGAVNVREFERFSQILAGSIFSGISFVRAMCIWNNLYFRRKFRLAMGTTGFINQISRIERSSDPDLQNLTEDELVNLNSKFNSLDPNSEVFLTDDEIDFINKFRFHPVPVSHEKTHTYMVLDLLLFLMFHCNVHIMNSLEVTYSPNDLHNVVCDPQITKDFNYLIAVVPKRDKFILELTLQAVKRKHCYSPPNGVRP